MTGSSDNDITLENIQHSILNKLNKTLCNICHIKLNFVKKFVINY